MFDTNIPQQPDSLPRAIPPDVDTAVMTAVGGLDDRFARVGITVLRHTGLRIGELLDLELEDLVNDGRRAPGCAWRWGSSSNERLVPVDDAVLEALDEWLTHRAGQGARPHPRDGHLADLIFVEGGRRIGTTRIQRGLRNAVIAAGLTGPTVNRCES